MTDLMTVSIEDEAVVIRMPLAAMQAHAEAAPFVRDADPLKLYDPAEGFVIDDPLAFAAAMTVELTRPHGRDGATVVNELFEDAMQDVVNKTGPGFRWPAAGFGGEPIEL